MPQIFPKKANVMPLLSLAGSLVGGIDLIFVVWYYFSPEYTDVGYAPQQSVPFSHRLHVGQLGMHCQNCHTNVQVRAAANIPATQTCMNCDSQIQRESINLYPVRERWASGLP